MSNKPMRTLVAIIASLCLLFGGFGFTIFVVSLFDPNLHFQPYKIIAVFFSYSVCILCFVRIDENKNYIYTALIEFLFPVSPVGLVIVDGAD